MSVVTFQRAWFFVGKPARDFNMAIEHGRLYPFIVDLPFKNSDCE